MAKFEEADQRWLVKDLGSEGTNVNNCALVIGKILCSTQHSLPVVQLSHPQWRFPFSLLYSSTRLVIKFST